MTAARRPKARTAPARTASAELGAKPGPKESRSTEGDTRRQVMLLLLKEGPITASYLGKRLGLSAAGVRRHLDILVEEGLTEVVNRRPVARNGEHATRGRPAKHFRLTDAGRAQFGHAYDALASDALSALREVGGSEAVKAFAIARMERLVDDIRPSIREDESVEEVARRLAEALDAHGFAATVDRAGKGVQICQHHCPVAHVAAEHPELCEAEQEVISSVLGTHVQPLATIVNGHGICTTNIPLTPINTRRNAS